MPSPTGPRALARARKRGAVAAVVTLVLSLAVVVAVIAGLREIPPGVVSLLLVPPLAVAGHAAVVEWRGSQATITPVPGWAMIGVAFLAGLPAAWLSLFVASMADVPPNCPGPVPVPGGVDAGTWARCHGTTSAGTAGFTVWAAVVGVTAVLLLAGIAMARRTATVRWLAVPLALAGCVIAFDLGHMTWSAW